MARLNSPILKRSHKFSGALFTQPWMFRFYMEFGCCFKRFDFIITGFYNENVIASRIDINCLILTMDDIWYEMKMFGLKSRPPVDDYR